MNARQTGSHYDGVYGVKWGSVVDQKQDAVVCITIPFVSEEVPFSSGHHVVGDRVARMRYLDALRAEARAVAAEAQDFKVRAVKVGGGSPSIMSPDKLGEMLCEIRTLFGVSDECEITMEATPHTVGVPSLTGWGQGKVNRVVLHVDSVQPEELITLGRPFDATHVQNALLYLDKFRLTNVDVEVLYGIPGQTTTSLKRTVRSLAGIEPAHITLAPLLALDDGVQHEQAQRELYEAACERLEERGYHQYAAGKFARAKRGREEFTLALCNGAALIGLGMDAQSCFGGIAYKNTPDFATYVAHSAQADQVVVAASQIDALTQARMFVRNRLTCVEGFTPEAFTQANGKMPPAVVAELEDLVAKGLVTRSEGAWKLTSLGMFTWVR